MIFENTVSTCGYPFLISLQQTGKTFMNHYHKEVELLYIKKGEMNIYTYGGNSKLSAGDIMIIPPYMEHAVLPFQTNCERIAILLDIHSINTAFSNILHEDSVLQAFEHLNGNSSFWKAATHDKIASLLQCVYDEYLSQKRGWEYFILSMFLQLFTIVIRELPRLEQTPAKIREIRTIQNALEYISQNYTGEISLNACACAVGLNSSYFSRLFHATVGTSFQNYVTQLRIEKAKWLLRHTDEYIINVSMQSGFKNVKNFNHVFKIKTGFTPKEYRNR